MGEQRLMTLGNQSSSQLHMGTIGGRDPPTPRRDEDPSWGWEDPSPPGGEADVTFPMLFIIKDITIIIIIITVNPSWGWEDPLPPPQLFHNIILITV